MNSPKTETANDQNMKKLGELIQDIQFAMLTTVQSDGTLYSRPMATQKAPFDGTLWFFTGASTHKAEDIRANPQVNLSFAKPGDQTYVTVTGHAEIVRDRGKAEEFWNPMYRAWFPKGLEDPDLILLKVTVDRAEYWDSPSSPVAHLVGLAKAVITGKSAESVGDNKKLSLG